MTYQSNTLFFYKGSAFPIANYKENVGEITMGLANEMIVTGLKSGFSMEDQKRDYKLQLDAMEQAIWDNTTDSRNAYDTLDKAIESLNALGLKIRGYDEFHTMWSLNVCALLKMKVINNDNDNGILTTKQLIK